jgi:hypothetical protein
MYVKVDYSVEAKKNPHPNMTGEYAIYTKNHWWNKWIERQTYADLELAKKKMQRNSLNYQYFFIQIGINYGL